MKKLITLGIYGILVFAASGASAWFFHSKALNEEMTKSEEPEPTSLTPARATGDDILTSRKPQEVIEDQESPVAVRPEKLSVEEIVRLGLSLKMREQGVRDREESLKKIESRQELMLQDMEFEQKEIQGMVEEARQQRGLTIKLLQEIKQRETEIEKKAMAIQVEPGKPDTRLVTEADRATNLKELTEVVQIMEPEKAAGVLKGFANDGKSDMAVQLLSKMEEKKAAAVLEAMDDEVLMNELIAKFLLIKRPPPRSAKR